MVLTNTTVIRPAQTDSSNTPASGASIWNIRMVTSAEVSARAMAPRKSVGASTAHSALATTSPSSR
jgi:hypothetical protein